MQFTELTFLLVFLPIMLIVYYLAKEKVKPIVAIAFSIAFYTLGAPEYIGMLCISVVVNICISYLIVWLGKLYKENASRNIIIAERIIVLISVVMNIIVLASFKYSKTMVFPLGLSFYTFKVISLLADSYFGKIETLNICLAIEYLFFFPQITSGPISRYTLFSKAEYKPDLFYKGTSRFMMGVSKKILLADTLYIVTSEVFAAETLSTALCWLGSICFSLQLYYDFSGYSDMAIGLSNMMGIECEENFNYPYTTKTISEFWRRWHMTLGAFFKDYVYIPLGGSKKGIVRTIINLLIVWVLTGIWHGNGKTFIIWGVMYFVAISLEKVLKINERIKSISLRILYRVFTLFYINALWVVFNSDTLSKAGKFIKTMIIYTPEYYCDARTVFLLKDYSMPIAFAIILSMPLAKWIKGISTENELVCSLVDIFEGAIVIIAFFISLAFILNGYNNPFLYANF